MLSIYCFEENDVSEKEIANWWKDIKFSKLTIRINKIKRASQKRNIGKLPYGTAEIYVNKSIDLYFQIIGGIEFLKTTI